MGENQPRAAVRNGQVTRRSVWKKKKGLGI